jgi:post-segregation antitoxin (ccd killing protein)
MAPRPKTSVITARVTAEDMEYLLKLANDLEITLSDALRAAIARSLLRDVQMGELKTDDEMLRWVASNAREVRGSDPPDDVPPSSTSTT